MQVCYQPPVSLRIRWALWEMKPQAEWEKVPGHILPAGVDCEVLAPCTWSAALGRVGTVGLTEFLWMWYGKVTAENWPCVFSWLGTELLTPKPL